MYPSSFFRFTLGLLASLLQIPAFGQQLHSLPAFNKALEQQRSLVYCIAKDYAYAGMQVEATRAQREMDSCVQQFEHHYREMTMSPLKTSQVAKSLGQLFDLWNDYRLEATGGASREHAPTLLAKAEKLILAITALEPQLAASAAKKQGYQTKVVDPLIQTSSRLATLAQAIALDYAFCAWKLPTDTHCSLLATHEKDFSLALYELLTSTANGQLIEDEISVIAKYWKAIKGIHHQTGQPALAEAFSLASVLSNQSAKVSDLYFSLAN